MKALESSSENEEGSIDYKKGIIPSVCIVIGLILILTLTPVHYNDDNWEPGLLYNDSWFVLGAGLAVVCLFLCTMLWFLKDKKYYKHLLIFITAAICAI